MRGETKREERERREGVDTERVKMSRQEWGGSCHTSREMFQMMFFICCNGVVPFIGEPKRDWIHSLLSNSALQKRSDRPLMFVQVFRRNPPADFPVWEVSFPQVGLQGMSGYINCRLLEQDALCKSVEMHCPFSKHVAVRQ